jgi:hypothetical protein
MIPVQWDSGASSNCELLLQKGWRAILKRSSAGLNSSNLSECSPWPHGLTRVLKWLWKQSYRRRDMLKPDRFQARWLGGGSLPPTVRALSKCRRCPRGFCVILRQRARTGREAGCSPVLPPCHHVVLMREERVLASFQRLLVGRWMVHPGEERESLRDQTSAARFS